MRKRKVFYKIALVTTTIVAITHVIFTPYINIKAQTEFDSDFCWFVYDRTDFRNKLETLPSKIYFPFIVDHWARSYLGLMVKDPFVLPPHFGIVVPKTSNGYSTESPENPNIWIPPEIYGWSYFQFEFWEIGVFDVTSQAGILEDECEQILEERRAG